MRVISQKELTIKDFPYNQTSFFVIEKKIFAVSNHFDRTLVAEYSTEEKAEKAMEMLHEEYLKFLYSEGGLTITDSYAPAFAFVRPKIFQFPADDEIKE